MRSRRWCVMLFALLALMMSGCFPIVITREDPVPREATEACADFCKGPFRIDYRNSSTYFCECLKADGGIRGSAVIGRMGTVYR